MRKMKIILYLYLMLVLCLTQLFTLFAAASSVELIPTEDSYIDYDDPSKNYGSASTLWTWGEVCYGSSCFGSKTFLKFDLSEVPSSATITSAELKLYLSSTTSPTSTVNVFYCSNNNWNELLINWYNAPSFQSTPIDTCYTVAFEGWYSWTVTTAVNKALSTRTLTLVLDEQEHIAISSFYSKDSYYSWGEDQRPILTIVYTYEQPNTSPTAGFSYSPSNPTTDDTIQFTDASSDSDGTITFWSWNFGDEESSTTKNPQHKYSTSGTYTATLEVTDNDGAKKSISKTITINQPEPPNNPPTANFSFTPLTATTDDTMQFTDISIDTDGTITSFLWNFGDETSSTSKNPKHRYTSNGAYSITLEITDNDGATDLISKTILVEKPHSNETGNGTNKGTPGYELIIVVCAIALVLLWKRKRIKV